MTTSHRVELAGLQSGALYTFQIKSQDPSGNTRICTGENASAGCPALSGTSGQQWSEYRFATLGAAVGGGTLENIQISDINVTLAGGMTTISWNTSATTQGFVQYGFDDGFREIAGSPTTGTTHSVTLPSDILGKVTYIFQVRAQTDDGQEATSRDIAVFTAPPSSATQSAEDSQRPTISLVAVVLVTEDSAVLSWVTDEAASTYVEYGFNRGSYFGTTTPSLLGLSHSATLSNLSSNQAYYYRITAIDVAQNLD